MACVRVVGGVGLAVPRGSSARVDQSKRKEEQAREKGPGQCREALAELPRSCWGVVEEVWGLTGSKHFPGDK